MDKLMFLYKFLQSPQSVGSITPSSRFLASAMMNYVDWDNDRKIVELGAGTGIFTKQINELMHSDSEAIIFEKDDAMRQSLQERFPALYYEANARDISMAVSDRGWGHVDCVISGLPFAIFSEQVRKNIMDEVYASLKPGGVFIAFQYSLQMKRLLSSYFEIENISFVALNFPPAFIYFCRKK